MMKWVVCYKEGNETFLEMYAYNKDNAIEIANQLNAKNNGKEYFIDKQESMETY